MQNEAERRLAEALAQNAEMRAEIERLQRAVVWWKGQARDGMKIIDHLRAEIRARRSDP